MNLVRQDGFSNLSNTDATRLGLKVYLWNVAYNNNIMPSITTTATGTVVRALFIPYQVQDGTWRMKFNLYVSCNATARSQFVVTVNGMTSKASFQQAFNGIMGSTTVPQTYFPGGDSELHWDHPSGSYNFYAGSGDIELNSKPTWAY